MRYFRLKFALVFCVTLSIFAVNRVMAQNVTVNLNSEKQFIRGFGGMNYPAWIGDLTTGQINTAFGNESGQIGMTVLRIPIEPNSNSWNSVVSSAKQAIEKGAIVFASPWNAPSSMLSGGHVNASSYGAYTDHLNSFNTYMKNNGVDLYAISVQNEPDYGDWTRWTSEEMLKFMKENASAIQNRVIAPESFQYRKEMSDPILNDPTALANLDILGAHLYGTQLKEFPYPLFKEKGEGKELWMTEVYTDSDNDADQWPLALDVAENIHHSLVEAEFNVYVWWYIRRSYGMIKENGQVSKRGYCMAHYSKFVRPGYVRVDATKDPASNVYVSAYKNEDDEVVIVAVNRNNSSQTLSFSFADSDVGSLTKYTTSASKNVQNDGSVEVTDGSFTVTLDDQSVTTLTGTGSSTPPVPQSPYNEEPHQVPGRIEAEEYDLGGEGKAYHEENVNGNEGGADFRDDQVDIETTGDTTGLYNICYILQDEWLEYTVNVVTSSIYTLELRVASEDESKSLHIEMDGENLTGDIEIPNTGDWQNWTTVSVGINLTEGQHIMRIAFDSDYMNLNFVEFKDQETLVKNRKSIISNSSSKLILAHVAEGFKIKIEGDFNYRLTDLKGAIIEAGKGKNVVIVGVGLTPGVYLISVRNKMNKFIRKVINN